MKKPLLIIILEGLSALLFFNAQVFSQGYSELSKITPCSFKKITNPVASLLDDQDPLVRKSAAVILGSRKNYAAVAALIQALKDNDEFVRTWSCWALGRIGSPEATSSIIPLLKDPNENVRSMAVWALARIEKEKAFPYILKKLKDKNTQVQFWAAASLEFIGKQKEVDSFLASKKTNLPLLRNSLKQFLKGDQFREGPKAILVFLRYYTNNTKSALCNSHKVLLEDAAEINAEELFKTKNQAK